MAADEQHAPKRRLREVFSKRHAGTPDASQRRLAERLHARGYALSHSTISLMDYAINHLLPAMPRALRAGLGKRPVAQLRALDHAAETVWRNHAPEPAPAYRTVFTQALAANDTEDWTAQRGHDALKDALAQHVGLPVQQLSAELAAALPGQMRVASDVQADTHHAHVSVSAARSDPEQATVTAHANVPPPAAAPLAPPQHPPRDDDKPPGQAIVTASGATDNAHSPPLEDLKSLRARAWTLATKLAKHYHFDALIQPLPRCGLGYVVVDVIDPTTLVEGDPAKAGERETLWWHLVACAELTCAPIQDLQSVLHADGMLLQALREGDLTHMLDGYANVSHQPIGYRVVGAHG